MQADPAQAVKLRPHFRVEEDTVYLYYIHDNVPTRFNPDQPADPVLFAVEAVTAAEEAERARVQAEQAAAVAREKQQRLEALRNETYPAYPLRGGSARSPSPVPSHPPADAPTEQSALPQRPDLTARSRQPPPRFSETAQDAPAPASAASPAPPQSGPATKNPATPNLRNLSASARAAAEGVRALAATVLHPITTPTSERTMATGRPVSRVLYADSPAQGDRDAPGGTTGATAAMDTDAEQGQTDALDLQLQATQSAPADA